MQRCQFHLQQNAQAYVARLDQREPIARRIRAIFNAPDQAEARRLLAQAIELWRKDAPRLAEWAERSLRDGFAVFDYPQAWNARMGHGGTDRSGIVGIVLLTDHEGFDVLRRQQMHRMPHRLQQPAPVVGASAGFHANFTGRQIAQERQHLNRSGFIGGSTP
ncbi:MAG: transposase [Lysobacter sp.]|nr:transposase [Lysobacter sp.]